MSSAHMVISRRQLKRSRSFPGSKKKRWKMFRRPVRRSAPAGAYEERVSVWRHAYLALWALFVLVTVYALFFSSFLTIRDIRISGNRAVDEEGIRALIREDLQGRYNGLWPNDNLLWASGERMESRLKDRFRQIRTVRLEKVFPSTLSVTLEERKTVLLWCSQGKCFYIDEEGYAYDEADTGRPEDADGSFLRITDMSDQFVDMREPVLDKSFVQFALQARESFREMLGIETAPEASTPSRLSSELRLKTREGWEAYLDTALPLEKSVRTLGLLLKKEISQEDRPRLKYVDMRSENRFYYAFQGDEGGDVAGETSEQPESSAVSEEKKKNEPKDGDKKKDKKK
jgi:cell division septal protein FtsQ